ncbi:hypothetical protein CASFOL_016164 [Castilleja foliolosa]|uniref:GH10 domain-containing protein n=1 Tax=Castilleja foliolosa TaxID=1961234 RepID=A0ABD3DFT1_9LAMI
MEKLLSYTHMFFIVIIGIAFALQARAELYDDSYTLDCLATPPKAQYKGGMVINPEFNEGLNGWKMFEDAKVYHVTSNDGNKFIAASNRNPSYRSFTQTFDLETDKLYTFSAWLQVSHGKADIAAVFMMETGPEIAGWVTARKGCWSMLKGGLVVKAWGPADLHFATNNTDVDILADSISLHSFTQEEWKSHQQQKIHKVRRKRVRLQAVDQTGRPMANATVSLTQTRPGFPIGCTINQNILHNPAYQSWFLSRFKFTVFENELKWYSTEYMQGVEDYTTADAMMQFAESHNVIVRGHNVLWDNPSCQPQWARGLSGDNLFAAANKRTHSVVSRYKGRLIHWDVVNENMHYNFFETQLGKPSASTYFYQTANQIDPNALLFLNEFNTIECSGDPASSPSKYVEKINLLKAQGYNSKLAIGVQGHFPNNINLVYLRTALETLAQTGLPIWVTELDVSAGPNQAAGLDQVLHELYSNPAVQGIMIWAAPGANGCYAMCLTDNYNFNNLDTGNVVDNFMGKLKQGEHDDFDSPKTTDSNGFFETSLPHGEYEVKMSHPRLQEFYDFRKINIAPNKKKFTNSRVYRFTIIDPEN